MSLSLLHSVSDTSSYSGLESMLPQMTGGIKGGVTAGRLTWIGVETGQTVREIVGKGGVLELTSSQETEVDMAV